jgi:hypothetical protein
VKKATHKAGIRITGLHAVLCTRHKVRFDDRHAEARACAVGQDTLDSPAHTQASFIDYDDSVKRCSFVAVITTVVFNLRLLRARSKIFTAAVRDVQLARSTALIMPVTHSSQRPAVYRPAVPTGRSIISVGFRTASPQSL